MNLFAKKFTGLLTAAALATASCAGIALIRNNSYQTSQTLALENRIYTEYENDTQTLSIFGTGTVTGAEFKALENKEDIRKNWGVDKVFEANISAEDRKARIKGWKKAVKTAIFWAEN